MTTNNTLSNFNNLKSLLKKTLSGTGLLPDLPRCAGCGKVNSESKYTHHNGDDSPNAPEFMSLYCPDSLTSDLSNISAPKLSNQPTYQGQTRSCMHCGFPTLTTKKLIRIGVVGFAGAGKSMYLLGIAKYLGEQEGQIQNVSSLMTLSNTRNPMITDSAIAERYNLNEQNNIESQEFVDKTIPDQNTLVPFVFDVDIIGSDQQVNELTISFYDVAGETVLDAVNNGKAPTYLAACDIYLVLIDGQEILTQINGLQTGYSKRRIYNVLDFFSKKFAPNRTIAMLSKSDVLQNHVLPQRQVAFVGAQMTTIPNQQIINQQLSDWRLKPINVPICAMSSTGGADITKESLIPNRLGAPIILASQQMGYIDQEGTYYV